MPYIRLGKTEKAIMISASVVIWAAVITAYFLYYRLTLEEIFPKTAGVRLPIPMSDKFILGLYAATIASLLPYSIVSYLNDRYVESIERTLPDVFKALSDGIRAGMTLPHAVEETGRGGYGPMGELLKKIAARASLGLDFKEAVDKTVEGIEVPSLKRAARVLKIAYESGGRTFEVLDTAAKVYRLLWSYVYERRTSVRQYVLTVYASLLIFLVIGMVLVKVFFEPLAVMGGTLGGMLFVGVANPALYKAVVMYTAFVEGILGGLIAGKMSRGTVKSGVPHIVAQLAIGYAFFSLAAPLMEGMIAIPTP